MLQRCLSASAGLILLTTLALAASGCGTHAPVADAHYDAAQLSSGPGAGASQVQAISDQPLLHRGAPVDSRVVELLRATPTPSTAALPALPGLDGLTRFTAAVSDSWQDGAAAASKSQGATVQGASLVLTAGANGTEWAIYHFSGVATAAQLQTLKVDTTAGQFSGSDSGYWVAVANYSKQRWDVLGRSSQANYTAPLSGSAAYLSASNNVYIAVLISGGQSVTISRAGLTLDTSPWQQLTLSLPAHVAGLMPCLDFTGGDNPAVAWADDTDKAGYFAICDRTTGFGNASSWSVSPFDDDPASATTPPSPNAKVQWLDMVIDPGVSLPRISCLYTGLDGLTGGANTMLGCTALGIIAGSPQWLNWRMAPSDSSTWTSIARKPADASYAIVYCAGNPTRHTDTPPRNLNDMEYRSIVWDNASTGQISTTSGALYYGFGTDWKNPHLRFANNSKSTVDILGGTAWQEGTSITTWNRFYNEVSSGPLGSLAFTPAGTAGISFLYTGTAGAQELAYVGFDGNYTGQRVKADGLSSTGSNAIAESSQLAYQSNGTPGIAYTYRTSAGIEIRYAFLTGQNWTVETVSDVNGTPTDPLAPVYVDLAFDSNNVAAVCWTQRSGNNSVMDVALRGS